MLYSQRDPLEFIDGPNTYYYVQANPTNLIDPSGMTGFGSNSLAVAIAADKLLTEAFPPKKVTIGKMEVGSILHPKYNAGTAKLAGILVTVALVNGKYSKLGVKPGDKDDSNDILDGKMDHCVASCIIRLGEHAGDFPLDFAEDLGDAKESNNSPTDVDTLRDIDSNKRGRGVADAGKPEDGQSDEDFCESGCRSSIDPDGSKFGSPPPAGSGGSGTDDSGGGG